MQRAVRTLVVGLVGALLLGGCFRVESSFDIKDDGTADVVFEFAFDLQVLTEFAALFGQDVEGLEDMSVEELFSELGEPTDPCADVTEGLGDYDITEEDISTGDEVAVRCTVQDVPLADLTEVGEDSSLSISQTDGATSFEASLGGVDEAFAGVDETLLPGLGAEDLLEFTFRATAPGSLVEHNATSTDGATAIWTITPDAEFVSGDTASMSARWEPGSDSSSNWIIALVIAVIALAVVIGIVVAVRSRNGAPAEAATDSTVPPPPPPPTGAAATAPPASAPGSPPPPPPPAPSPNPPADDGEEGGLPPPTG